MDVRFDADPCDRIRRRASPLNMIATSLFAALACALALIVFMRAAGRLRLLDRAGGHKQHAAPVPAVGGLAIFAGLAPVWLVLSPGWPGALAVIGSAALVAVGVWDDRNNLRARWRFAVQLFAVATMVAAGIHIQTLGNLLGMGPVAFGPGTGALFTAACVVAMINAVNMLDGLDGLAGGIALGAVGCLGYGAWRCADAQALGILLAIAAALLVFLAVNARHPFNPRARVYLGDAGSTLLGFWLVWFAVDLAQPGDDAPLALTPITVVYVLAVPLLEVMTNTVRRIAQGRSPVAPDREHVHHLLLAAGFAHHHAVAIRCTAATALGALGLIAWQVGIPEVVLAVGFVGLWLVHLAWVTRAGRLYCITGRNAVRS